MRQVRIEAELWLDQRTETDVGPEEGQEVCGVLANLSTLAKASRYDGTGKSEKRIFANCN